jgi:hypothetical protein
VEAHESLGAACTSRKIAVKLLPLFLSLPFWFLPAAHLPAQSTPDVDFQRGMELAKQEQWAEAKKAFENGRRRAPHEKRFPIELAGIAFKEHRYDEARKYLRCALSLDSRDEYALQFLGTIYFLQGNIEAALLHWNKVGRPLVEAIKISGEPEVRPALLDRAFAVSFASVLKLDDFQETKVKIESLEIFPRYSFRLVPRNDEKFDLVFAGTERNGLGNTKIETALSILRGLPYGTVYPEYYNWKGSAINVLSLLRWDPKRRRVRASLSGPLQHDPKLRVRFTAEARDEVWNVNGLSARDFNLRSAAAGFELDSLLGAHWKIANSISLDNRSFKDLSLFQEGSTIEYSGTVTHQREFPEPVLSSTTYFTLDAGRFLNDSDRYVQLEAGNSWSAGWWKAGIRAAKTFGSLPFDHFYILGVDRDGDFWLRAHSNLTGKKGELPIGRNFVLINSEADKTLYRHPFFRWTIGPFLDTAKIFEPLVPASAQQWFFDSGMQMKLHVLNSITANVVYARNLRAGSDSFYIYVTR